MEAWQKPGEVNTGMTPGLSQHLPAGWGSPGGSGTRLQPGTEPDTGTRMLQTFMDRNSATAVSSVMANDVPRLRLASKSQKMAMNSTASPQQRPHSGHHGGATAAPWADSQHAALSRGFWGAGSHSLWTQHPLPAGSPPWSYLFIVEPLPLAF